MVSKVIELFLLVEVFQRKRYVSCHLGEQFDLIVVK